MQTLTSSIIRASRRRAAPAAAPAADSSSIFDGLIAARRSAADAFDLLQDELAQVQPDRTVCVGLLMKIDALLAPPPRPEAVHAVLSPAASDDDHAAMCARLQALAEADLAWRAKAELLMELVEERVFDALFASSRAANDAGHDAANDAGHDAANDAGHGAANDALASSAAS